MEIEFGLLKFVLQIQDVGFKIVVAYQQGMKLLNTRLHLYLVFVKTVLSVLQILDYLWAYPSVPVYRVDLQGGRKGAILQINVLGPSLRIERQDTRSGQEDKNTGQKKLR